MSEATDKIIERKFKFSYRKRDLFWYAYGVVFTFLNGIFLVQSIMDGEVAGIIFSGLILVFVIVASIFIPYMEQQTDFYRQRHFDLVDEIIGDAVAKNAALIVANKDLTVANEKLQAEVNVLKDKLAKKVG